MRNKKLLQRTLLFNLIIFVSCFSPVYISAQKTVAKKLTPRQIAQQTLPSTVLLVMTNNITKEAKSGSGFFVAEDVIVTNFHVIKETTEGYTKIYGQDKIYEILGLVGVDEKNDLALLKIKNIKGKPLKLNTDDSIAIGDEVFAVGNPKGLEGTFSQGIVSSIRKTNKDNLLQITASISAGSSGGAILNNKGEVIGVAVGAIESGQSLNFAIPVSLLRSLVLKQNPITQLRLSLEENEKWFNSKDYLTGYFSGLDAYEWDELKHSFNLADCVLKTTIIGRKNGMVSYVSKSEGDLRFAEKAYVIDWENPYNLITVNFSKQVKRLNTNYDEFGRIIKSERLDTSDETILIKDVDSTPNQMTVSLNYAIKLCVEKRIK